MSVSKNERAVERIPYSQKVKVVSMGRMVAYAMAVNVGLKGVLLIASPTLPVGSSCRVTLPVPDGEGVRRLEAEGTVVRSGAGAMAIQFADAFEPSTFGPLFQKATGAPHFALLTAYQNYFRVSRNQDLADCERLLGVSKRTFRTTFYITFASCISLAILPVWLFRDAIPPYPNWVKIVLSFTYGAIWLAIIQPTLDLTVFRVLRQRHSSRSGA
ncbi:hypothetical protein [Geothrix edaphica]|uniref:PilZ domain-containing protein n=1 Tax=Geothrix edaphica TaxID=2927976 RepID=A0ABQ5PVD9_9BACT|nr:hypothetical protein [Geothrix edaphica]GLH66268.1 hypothetical protein GETHED_06320 [Geothrix edaphica]